MLNQNQTIQTNRKLNVKYALDYPKNAFFTNLCI